MPPKKIWPWAERLDRRGKHLKPAKERAQTAARFDGPTHQVTDDKGTWDECESMIIYNVDNEAEQMRLCVGDKVYLTGEKKGKFAEIVKIESIFLGADGSLYFFNSFYWRAEAFKLGDSQEWEVGELYLQSTQDLSPNSVACIELTPVTIYSSADDFRDVPHQYFQRRTWDPDDGLSPLPVPPPPAGEAQPMDAEATSAAPGPSPAPGAAGAAQPAVQRSAPRRNAAADRARISELEAQVAELQLKLSEMDTLKVAVLVLERKMDALSAAE